MNQLKKIAAGGEVGYDYLFADAALRFAPTKFIVIDTEKDAFVGESPNTNAATICRYSY